ncbi:MAG: hypothetical protein M3Z25_09465 [Actinomycetota bacterium]|nr:hypothetical protein [Actinomycetota bacterium]
MTWHRVRLLQPAAVGISQAELSRAETGRGLLETRHELPRLLRVYQVDPDGTKQVLDMARAVGQALLSARAILQRGTAHFQQRRRDIEEQAETAETKLS